MSLTDIHQAPDTGIEPEIDLPVFRGPDDRLPTLPVAPLDGSVDGQGGTLNGKPVWDVDQIAAHLNRGGAGWTPGGEHAVAGDPSAQTLVFGFHTAESMFDEPYVYEEDGELYGLPEYFAFAPFTEAQRAAAREAMEAWDDVIAPRLVEGSAAQADITFANYTDQPGTQAYAYLPYNYEAPFAKIAGDVWISANQASNFQLDEGLYGIHTLVHESGHALGLQHPGDYNAAPGVSITYPANADYYQDARVYTVMSYFNANNVGARHFDFNISTLVYAATPLVHDIAAMQAIYGADMSTRTGDTVYGFNSNAGRDSYDFAKTPAPVMAIWDAGGRDTLDASGYATDQILDLRPGSLSSIGGVTYDTAPAFEQVNANRSAAGYAPITRDIYDANMAALQANPVVGRLTDNVAIAYGATIENGVGGRGSDLMTGNAVANRLTGNAGNDTLDGGAGGDTLDGGAGDDRYLIDNTADRIEESSGGGRDTVASAIDYRLGLHLENLTLTGEARSGHGNTGDNQLTGNAAANQLFGESGDDTLFGSDGADRLEGGTGEDVLEGQAGADTVIGGTGEDELAGGAGSDVLLGDTGEDVLAGGDGDDTLNGGTGDDTLDGAAGLDLMSGGTGDDLIVFGPGSVGESLSLDIVLDYRSTGDDRFDFRGLDADLGVAGDQAFQVLGAVGDGAGELVIQAFASLGAAAQTLGVALSDYGLAGDARDPATVIFGYVDGDQDADFAVLLAGARQVSASGWLL